MTLKQIVDESLDPKIIQAQITSLKQTSDNINKNIKMNPALQKQFGNDAYNLYQQTNGIEQSFQQILKDQMAKKKEEQNQQMQKNIQIAQNNQVQTTASVAPNSQTANGASTQTTVANI